VSVFDTSLFAILSPQHLSEAVLYLRFLVCALRFHDDHALKTGGELELETHLMLRLTAARRPKRRGQADGGHLNLRSHHKATRLGFAFLVYDWTVQNMVGIDGQFQFPPFKTPLTTPISNKGRGDEADQQLKINTRAQS
jgi:hypothetical protein